jgi:uncharacterized protein (TIGR02147 family)
VKKENKVSPQDFIRNELQRRIDKNPRYTMRAFAKSLNLNIGTLSSLLQGRRPLTQKTAVRLFEKLGTAPHKQSEILEAIDASRAPTAQIEASLLRGRMELDEEIFQTISAWYHYGILQLVRTDNFGTEAKHSSARCIARKLKISETEASLAIERLLNVGLLKKNEKGVLTRTQNRITTANKTLTSAALKSLQKQIREKAIHSIENDSIDVRCMTSMTMAIDSSKIGEARNLIEEFQERLSRFLEKGRKESVYQLSVSLFPLQEMEN